MSVNFSNRGWIKQKTEEKPLKEKKQKEPKKPKIKLPKPEKELIPLQYVNSIIDKKYKQIFIKISEIEELQKILNALILKSDEDIILNERRAIISRIMSKLPKKEKDKDEKEQMFKNLAKDIKKFDEHFNITSDKLSNCDLKF